MDGEPTHPMTPGLPYRPMALDARTETITLVPFGCTRTCGWRTCLHALPEDEPPC